MISGRRRKPSATIGRSLGSVFFPIPFGLIALNGCERSWSLATDNEEEERKKSFLDLLILSTSSAGRWVEGIIMISKNYFI